jgi:hypothetical protein
VADEGKQRDFETGPDPRSPEEKLLTIIFSKEGSAVTESQRLAAISSLMKKTELDREGLVKRYTTKAGSGIDTAQIAQIVKLSVEITGLKQKIVDLKADLHRRDQMETLLMKGHQAEVDRIRNERNRLKAELDHLKIELAIMKSPSFPEIKCAAPGCANMFRPHRRDHTTCSNTCRKAISRARKKVALRSPDAREA